MTESDKKFDRLKELLEGKIDINALPTKKLEKVIKKAMELGSDVYDSAEGKINDTVIKSLKPIRVTKDAIKQALEELIEGYTLSVQAEVQLKPKIKLGNPSDEKKAAKENKESPEEESHV